MDFPGFAAGKTPARLSCLPASEVHLAFLISAALAGSTVAQYGMTIAPELVQGLGALWLAHR